MPLDPQCRAFMDQVSPPGTPPLNEMPVPLADIRRMMVDMSNLFGGPPTEGVRIENRSIPGPAGEMPVRLYTPAAPGPHPGLVYLHGGGWVLGAPEVYDAVCGPLARDVPCAVVSVDYRLAPEHRFPAAAEDCYAPLRHVA